MQKLIAILICSTLWSCNAQKQPVIDNMQQWLVKDSATNFFSLYVESQQQSILEIAASQVLYNLKEPYLSTYTDEAEIIRLTWLRAFENPIVVRVNIYKDYSYIVIKEAKRVNENSMVKIRDTVISIGSAQANSFKNQLLKSDFLSSGYSSSYSGKDGATWFLEYKTSKMYKVIKRWDEGYLTSAEVSKYLSTLIGFAEKFTKFKSIR